MGELEAGSELFEGGGDGGYDVGSDEPGCFRRRGNGVFGSVDMWCDAATHRPCADRRRVGV